MIRYLSTLRFPAPWLSAVSTAVPELEVRQIPAERPEDIPDAVWAEVEVLHTGSAVPHPARAPRLRWIQLDTAGIDHLAGHPIWSSDIEVTTIAGVSPVPMAEYVIMMVLALSHHLPALLAAQREHDWPSPHERWRRFLPRGVAGTTMVIIGYGRIGREIGRLARALGMAVVGVSRSGQAAGGGGSEVVSVRGLSEAVPRGDWLVIVTPLTEETRGLIDAAVLSRVKPGAVLIDVGRGGVLDETALVRALDESRLATAVLDVFATEPLPRDHPLWDHPKVVVTPHVSGFAPAYEREVLGLVTDNLRRYAAGLPLRNLVDGSRGY